MYLFRCHSLAEEPTEKKKKSSQALQQAIFTLIFRILILSLGGFPLRLNGVDSVVHISRCVCVLHFIALDLQTLDDMLIMGRKKNSTHTSLSFPPPPLSLKL